MKEGHGFQPDKLKPENYCFGGLQVPLEIIQEDGQWSKYLPEPEFQLRNNFESYNCVTYGTLNCLEILLKRQYGGEYNKSERYVGVMSWTSKYGNNPQKVIETIRKESGLIDEEYLPFHNEINNWNEYYSPDPMVEKYIKIGKKWLSKYIIKHEWVLNDDYTGKKQETLKDALKYSPIGISVYAWKINDIGLYTKDNEPDNHWVTLYGYREGEYWKVFDHYNDTYKKLVWNYKFGFAKRYYLKKEKVESWLQKIINFFKRLWQILQ